MVDGVVLINCVPFFRRFGITWPECSYAWLVKDPCGLVCVFITWLLVGYAQFVVTWVIVLPSSDDFLSLINGAVFTLLAFMCLASHSRCMLTDPGSVEMGTASKENIERIRQQQAGQVLYRCPKCVSIKPDRAHHCSICKRCIRKMDHHCPWVNNCIGESNQKYFVLFTMYIFIISCYAIVITIRYFVSCATRDWKGCSTFSPPVTLILIIFLLFEALLFGIFTAIMFGSQVTAICSDETGIENLKKEYRPEKHSVSWSFKSVFGHPFGLHWLSPFSTPRHVRPIRDCEV